jgi:hypothetical protein
MIDLDLYFNLPKNTYLILNDYSLAHGMYTTDKYIYCKPNHKKVGELQNRVKAINLVAIFR